MTEQLVSQLRATWRTLPDAGIITRTQREVINEAADALENALKRISELEGVVETAAKTFRRYAEIHRMKGTAEGNLKASNNDDLAEFCESALLPNPSEANHD